MCLDCRGLDLVAGRCVELAGFSSRVVRNRMRFAPAGANTPPYRGKTAKAWGTLICGEVMAAWPKTGFRSSKTPARRKRRVMRRRGVRDADMAKLLGTISVCRKGWVAASGLRH